MLYRYANLCAVVLLLGIVSPVVRAEDTASLAEIRHEVVSPLDISGIRPNEEGGDPAADLLRSKAAQQLRAQEHQRILGVLPEFNISNVPNALPLSPAQKFQLALKSAVDPSTFASAAFDAALSTWRHDFRFYGDGASGYQKRLGASYLDGFDGTLLGNALFPVLLHQDPRYFRKGTGSFHSRVFNALISSVRCKDDEGQWVPNYSGLLGTFAADGIANVYYPAGERGLSVTLQRSLMITAEGSLQTVFDEFWPDIARRLFHKSKE